MVPLVDLRMQYFAIRDEINGAITDVLESAQYVLGPAVRNLGSDSRSIVSADTNNYAT